MSATQLLVALAVTIALVLLALVQGPLMAISILMVAACLVLAGSCMPVVVVMAELAAALVALMAVAGLATLALAMALNALVAYS